MSENAFITTRLTILLIDAITTLLIGMIFWRFRGGIGRWLAVLFLAGFVGATVNGLYWVYGVPDCEPMFLYLRLAERSLMCVLKVAFLYYLYFQKTEEKK